MKQNLLILIVALLGFQVQAQKISNVTAKQEGNSIIVSYKIEGGMSDRVYSPTLYYSTDGGAKFEKCESTNSNYGKPNQSNQIIWNVTNDLDYFGNDNIVFKVIAYGFWNSVKGTANIGGKTYKTVKIGQQEWMAENLNLDVGSGCYCYNCAEYGILYSYEAAKHAASKIAGWHLSSDEDWKQLEIALGMSRSDANDRGWRGKGIGNKIKSTSDWVKGSNGTNSSGFNALPGSYRFTNAGSTHFGSKGKVASFWSPAVTDTDKSIACTRKLYSSKSSVERTINYVASSVRLVRD